MKYLNAAFNATLLLASIWLFAMVPVLSILILIVVMLPLMVLDGWGIAGLGDQSSGFFLPSDLGYSVLSIGGWLIFFTFFVVISKRADK